MTDDELLLRIRTTPWISSLLDWFGFDVTRVGDGPIEPVHLASGAPLEMIAGDGDGGAFMLVGAVGDRRPVVYVGAEGEGGLIARGLREALAIVVGLPNIHDVLNTRMDEDGGARLRAALASEDDHIREVRPELDADRARLREALDLPLADDLLEELHAAAADDAYRPINNEGNRYESMLP
jgi:hypothetical protein